MPRPFVSHPLKAARFFRRRGRRVICNDSDSNSVIGSHGWDDGLHLQAKARRGIYMTQPLTEFGMSSAYGEGYAIMGGEQSGVSSSDLPAALHNYFNWGADATIVVGAVAGGPRYFHVRSDTPGSAGYPPGTGVGNTAANVFGILTTTTPPFDMSRQLRFHVEVAQLEAPLVQGTYRLHVRRQSGAVYWQQSAVQTVPVGENVWSDVAAVIPAGAPQQNLQFMFSPNNVFEMKHDLAMGWFSIEDDTNPSGERIATRCVRGGSTVNDAVKGLKQMNTAARRNYLRHLVNPPNVDAANAGPYPILFRACYLTNDINPANADPDELTGAHDESSPDGYAAGYQALWNLIDEDMDALGYGHDMWALEMIPTPRLDAASLATIDLYIEAIYDQAAGMPNGFACDWQALVNDAYLVTNYYGTGGTDVAHGKSAAAFSLMHGLELDAIELAVRKAGVVPSLTKKILMPLGGGRFG